MFSALESCDINHLVLEAYLGKLILGFHEKKVENVLVKKIQLSEGYNVRIT